MGSNWSTWSFAAETLLKEYTSLLTELGSLLDELFMASPDV
jgi:hypothetical protein